jgi:subtilisin family serine protease
MKSSFPRHPLLFLLLAGSLAAQPCFLPGGLPEPSSFRLLLGVEGSNPGAWLRSLGVQPRRMTMENGVWKVAVKVPADKVSMLKSQARIVWMRQDPLRYLNRNRATAGIRAIEPTMDMLDTAFGLMGIKPFHAYNKKGQGVLIAIYDTGIDWLHPDFRNPDGTTRILAIWDQTLDTLKPGEHRPASFSYGVEYTKAQIDSELAGQRTGFIREMDLESHGTMSAGVAAGNGRSAILNSTPWANKVMGTAPEADLLIIRGSSNGSFASSDIIDGLHYIVAQAQLRGKPVVANFSINGNSGAHDGTDDQERTLDSLFTDASVGRFVTIGCGNDGLKKMHTQAPFAASDAAKVVEFRLLPYTPQSGKRNDFIVLDAWYRGGGILDVTVAVYDTAGVRIDTLGQFPYSLANPETIRGTANAGFLYIFNGRNPNNNGQNIYAQIFDDTIGASATVHPPVPGIWKFTFRKRNTGAPGTLNGWYLGGYGSDISGKWIAGDSLYTVGIPSTSLRGCAVGQLVTANAWTNVRGDLWTGFARLMSQYPDLDSTYPVSSLAPFSAKGPTADGRVKPDFTAPGYVMPCPRSATWSVPEDYLILSDSNYLMFSGTSVSAPVMAGLVALLLQAQPGLTVRQIYDTLKSQALHDGQTGAVPNTAYGYGKAHLNFSSIYPGMVSSGTLEPAPAITLQCRPNPFNPQIRFTVSRPGAVLPSAALRLRIYDLRGKCVATLGPAPDWAGSAWSVAWHPAGQPSGMYLAVLTDGLRQKQQKITLLK